MILEIPNNTMNGSAIDSDQMQDEATCQPAAEFLGENFNDWTTYTSIQIIFGFLYCLIFVTGLLTNFLIILAVWLKPTLRTVRNAFIITMATADIFMCFTALIITAITDLAKQWIFGRILCHLFPLFQAVAISIATFSLTCIALDRYVLIIYPTWNLMGSQIVSILVVVISTFAVLIALPSALLQRLVQIEALCEEYCLEEGWLEVKFFRKEVYSASCLFAQFIIPLILMTYWYTRIVRRLRQQNRYRESLSLITTREHELGRQISKIVIIMCLTFAACWAPYSLLMLLGDFKVQPKIFVDQEYFCHFVTHVVAMSSVIWNPILYGWHNAHFKRAFVEMLPFLAPYAHLPIRLPPHHVMDNNSNQTTHRVRAFSSVTKDRLVESLMVESQRSQSCRSPVATSHLLEAGSIAAEMKHLNS